MTGGYKRQKSEKVDVVVSKSRNQQTNKDQKDDFSETGGKRKRKDFEPDESVGRVGSQEYLVEKILGTQITEGTREYFVKWLGWESSYNSWEPEENMTGCQDLVHEFMKKVENKKMSLNKSSLRNNGSVNGVIPSVEKIANRDKPNQVQQTDEIKPAIENEHKMNVSSTDVKSSVKSISKPKDIAENIIAPIITSNPVQPAVIVGPQRQMKILQQKNVITINPDVIMKANDNAKFEFVVTTKLDRNIQKIYNKKIQSNDGDQFVLCEFEESNLIEVVPNSFITYKNNSSS